MLLISKKLGVSAAHQSLYVEASGKELKSQNTARSSGLKDTGHLYLVILAPENNPELEQLNEQNKKLEMLLDRASYVMTQVWYSLLTPISIL